MFIECRHILPGGRKCHAPALRGKPFCYHHAKFHFRNTVSRNYGKLTLPPIDNLTSIQAAVKKTIASLSSPFMDTERAELLLHGLSLAADLQKRIDKSKQST